MHQRAGIFFAHLWFPGAIARPIQGYVPKPPPDPNEAANKKQGKEKKSKVKVGSKESMPTSIAPFVPPPPEIPTIEVTISIARSAIL
jgi:hypothetical protein